MVAESKLDKKHLGIDNESTVHPSHSPQRELSKLWVSTQIFLCSTHLVLYISSHRDYRFKLPKNIDKQGKLFKTSLKWPKLARIAAVGVEQLHVFIQGSR